MIGMDILQPVVALMIWTMIIWVWMYVTRIPAMGKAGIDGKNLVGGVGADLRSKLPDSVNWKADNYNHLHEAPTVFYAVAIVLAIIGQGDGMNVPRVDLCRLAGHSQSRPGDCEQSGGTVRAVRPIKPGADGADPARRDCGLSLGIGAAESYSAASAASSREASSVARKRSPSSAAMQPIPAAVTAWRYT